MLLESKTLAYINSAHSIVVGFISYMEMKDAIHASPEVYFTMFLVLISLTFTNNILSGNKALTNAALICTIVVFILQVYFSIDVFSSHFQIDKLRKIGIISMNIIALAAHLIYRFKKH